MLSSHLEVCRNAALFSLFDALTSTFEILRYISFIQGGFLGASLLLKHLRAGRTWWFWDESGENDHARVNEEYDEYYKTDVRWFNLNKRIYKCGQLWRECTTCNPSPATCDLRSSAGGILRRVKTNNDGPCNPNSSSTGGQRFWLLVKYLWTSKSKTQARVC